MSRLTIELPSQAEQDAFNLRRWNELLQDPEVMRIEGRVQTDRHGQIIMSPPPSARHGSYQFRVADALRDCLAHGEVLTECPISTADGVRAAGGAWASEERMRELGNRSCFPKAPEICIEILSPRNSKIEIEEKKALYFDAGALEVWTCDHSGKISFYTAPSTPAAESSRLCPGFPATVAV
jgi:Uma2 family endonuclease